MLKRDSHGFNIPIPASNSFVEVLEENFNCILAPEWRITALTGRIFKLWYVPKLWFSGKSTVRD
ncbi:hypothetical protein H5410_034428, partial [Solanum commersonii]